MTYQILKVTGGVLSEFIESDISSLALELRAQHKKFHFLQVVDVAALGKWHDFYQPTSQIRRPIPEPGLLIANNPGYNYLMFSDPASQCGLYQLHANEIIYGPNLSCIHEGRDSIAFAPIVKYITAKSLNDVLAEFSNKGFSFFQSELVAFNDPSPDLLADKTPLEMKF